MPRHARKAPPPVAGGDPAWERRCGRLFEDLRRPAAAMVRRAFGRAFADEEIEDLYGAAWVGTLRALDRRREELDDEALRRYVLTAVANQASKELRRRGRRPTSPLEAARELADAGPGPAERAVATEQARTTRDALGALPPRRRAVIVLRYAWGLDPRQVCGLVEGLSPRAYRKEITRGVEELSAKLGGEHGVERRVHALGGMVSWTAIADVVGARPSAPLDRAVRLAERARESVTALVGRGEPADAATGLGAAGAAKLAAGGSKVLAACLGTGAAASACVAVGLGPAIDDGSGRSDARRTTHPVERAEHRVVAPPPAQPDAAPPPDLAPRPAPQTATPPETGATVAPDPTSSPPPAVDREFGLPADRAAVAAADRGEGGTGGGSAAREFGP